jgi:hypothetical protein
MSTYEDTQGAPVGGTGGAPAAQTPTQPAGASNTDRSAAGPPDTIPYTRFKEVNEKYQELKQFEQLQELGYTADSLQGLAEFEASLYTDPAETWLSLGERLDDLPQDVKDVIARHRDGNAGAAGEESIAPNPQAVGDSPPAWAEPLLDDYQDRQVQAEDAARRQTLDSILGKWDQADKDEGIRETPVSVKLSFIAAHAGQGTSEEEILQAARTAAMAYRNDILGNESVPGPLAGGGSPRPVPPSGAPPSTSHVPKTLEDARLAALNFIRERGGA